MLTAAADNVILHIDGVLYLKIIDPKQASYGVQDPEYAVVQLAQTTMRSEIGKIDLDTMFRERASLNEHIVHAINQAATPWGITCFRYEIRDIQVSQPIVEAMQNQSTAERRKRALILESEGARASTINVAEAEKQRRILASEAVKQEQINAAEGAARAAMPLLPVCVLRFATKTRPVAGAHAQVMRRRSDCVPRPPRQPSTSLARRFLSREARKPSRCASQSSMSRRSVNWRSGRTRCSCRRVLAMWEAWSHRCAAATAVVAGGDGSRDSVGRAALGGCSRKSNAARRRPRH